MLPLRCIFHDIPSSCHQKGDAGHENVTNFTYVNEFSIVLILISLAVGIFLLAYNCIAIDISDTFVGKTVSSNLTSLSIQLSKDCGNNRLQVVVDFSGKTPCGEFCSSVSKSCTTRLTFSTLELQILVSLLFSDTQLGIFVSFDGDLSCVP